MPVLRWTSSLARRYLRPGLALALIVLALLAGAGGSAAGAAAASQAQASVRLPGHVLPALAQATQVHATSRAANAESQPLTLTVVLNRTDEQGFQKYLADVENPLSPNHLRFLTQVQLTQRFGPSQQAYDSVLTWLTQQGFTLSEGSANHLTLTVKGTRAQAEKAFQINIGDYQLGSRSFYANDQDPAVPSSVATDIQAVAGLSSLAKPATPDPNWKKLEGFCSLSIATALGAIGGNKLAAGAGVVHSLACGVSAMILILAFDLCLFIKWGQSFASMGAPDPCPAILAGTGNAASRTGPEGLGWNGSPPFQPDQQPGGHARGSGTQVVNLASPSAAPFNQRIGLLEFDTFNSSDVTDWTDLIGLSPSIPSRLSKTDVNGGVATPGPGESEVLLDIDTLLLMDPAVATNYVVYDAPGSTSYQTLFDAMLNDPAGPPTVISNSWAYCEDQTSLADVQSIDSILAQAAGSGISVFNGSGDSGSTCLDGSPNTVAVPADSPHAIAVGGTTLASDPGSTWASQTWWNGAGDDPPTGQGGFGASRFFARPSFQDGLNSSPMRSVPDVVAPADPAEGIVFCQADAGGCPSGGRFGGTSLAAPEWAAETALLNQMLGRNQSNFNRSLYPLANSSAFLTPAMMGSDFAHVGLGSPNPDELFLALSGLDAGPLDAADALIATTPANPPADGATPAAVQIFLTDASGNWVSGKNLTLIPSPGTHALISAPSGPSDNVGLVTFTVTDNTIENVTFTVTDTTDNAPDGVQLQQTATIDFVSPPATAGGIAASPASVPADGQTASTITVTLKDAAGGVSGKTVNLSQGSGHSTITGPTPPVTDQNGQLTFSVTDTQTENVTYTAVNVTDGNLPVPGSATVGFTSGTTNSCSHGTPTAAAGWALSDFATGFPTAGSCLGPIGLAFDAAGNLYVVDDPTSTLYEFGTQGGEADGATELAQIPTQDGNTDVGYPFGLAFGKDGKLYATQGGGFEGGNGRVIGLDPATGQVLRSLVPYTGFGSTDCALGLATDPLSGDLFFSDGPCTLLGGEPYINRIANPASPSPTLTHYAKPGGSDGITFAPDGTLYIAQGDNIDEISGTNGPSTPTLTTVFTFQNTQNDTPGPDGVAVAPNPANPSGPPLLFVNRNDGTITELDLSQSPPTQTDIFTGGSRGDFVAVGPDGCLYATQTDRVIKVTKADGSCPFAPSSALPQIGLAPSTVSPNPATGSQATLTATLHNVSNPQGTQIGFSVTGANPQTQQVTADANGQAVFTYVGAHTGADQVVATATSGSGAAAITVTSSPASVTWGPGKDVTFLDLNTSQTSGAQNVPATLTAHLTDVSLSPPAPIAGQPLTLGIGSGPSAQGCEATTDSTGAASCGITPNETPGLYPLTASYAGSSAYTAATAQDSFSITSLMPTSLAYSGATTVNSSGQASLAAVLTARVGGVLQGKGVSFTLGSGASAQTCDGTTDGTGTATCSITVTGQPAGSAPIAATFPGDGTDAASFAQASFTACGKGDVNCDTRVDATDALCILRFVAGLPKTSVCPIPLPNPAKIATDGNASLDATDALCVLRHIANLPATNVCPAWGSQPASVSRAASGVSRTGVSGTATEGTGGFGHAALSLVPSSVAGRGRQRTAVQVQFDAARRLGSWTIDITYDPKAVKVVSCAAAAGGICNTSYAPGVIRSVGASAEGLSGSQTLATLSFEGLGHAKTSPLSVKAVSLTDPEGGSLQP